VIKKASLISSCATRPISHEPNVPIPFLSVNLSSSPSFYLNNLDNDNNNAAFESHKIELIDNNSKLSINLL